MSAQDKVQASGLTARELACLTARVPASGNAWVDAIITQGLRFSTAAQLMEAMIAGPHDDEYLRSAAHTSVHAADMLLASFRQGAKDGQENEKAPG